MHSPVVLLTKRQLCEADVLGSCLGIGNLTGKTPSCCVVDRRNCWSGITMVFLKKDGLRA